MNCAVQIRLLTTVLKWQSFGFSIDGRRARRVPRFDAANAALVEALERKL